jgi:hypothetical protein
MSCLCKGLDEPLPPGRKWGRPPGATSPEYPFSGVQSQFTPRAITGHFGTNPDTLISYLKDFAMTISLKPLPKILMTLAGGTTLLLAGFATAPTAFAAPELSVYIDGPEKLQVGLSGTYNVSATNDGDVSAPAEVFIIFAGKLDQTDQVTASGGLDCEVRHDAGINAAVRCTTPQLQPKTGYTIAVQGRGSASGTGQLVAKINGDPSVPEGGFGNPATANADNTFQKNVTIN